MWKPSPERNRRAPTARPTAVALRLQVAVLLLVGGAFAACGSVQSASLADCRGPYPGGQRLDLSTAQGRRTVAVHVGDVLSVSDPDPSRRPTATGDPVLCRFGGGEADGPPGVPPSSWVTYAVVRRGVEHLQIYVAGGRRLAVVIQART